MRFCLLDQILELEPGVRITAIKRLDPDEQYLKDHFPRFPVMPGVLMLEALFQASAWLVRQTDEFEHPAVILKEARNVKYSDFVSPGQTLMVYAEILKQEETTTSLKAHATVNGAVAVTARLLLERYRLGDKMPSRALTDPYLRSQTRKTLAKLLGASDTATGQVATPCALAAGESVH